MHGSDKAATAAADRALLRGVRGVPHRVGLMPGERLAAARGAVGTASPPSRASLQLLGLEEGRAEGAARALPEVREGCADVGAALGALDEAIAAEVAGDLGGRGGGERVLAHAAPRRRG